MILLKRETAVFRVGWSRSLDAGRSAALTSDLEADSFGLMSGLGEFVNAFGDRSLVVLGDLVADEYVYGATSRISREAPVLIVQEERREIRPGGAANVVANIQSMGGHPRPVGLLGDDLAGRALMQQLSSWGVCCDGLVVSDRCQTTTKTRVLAGGRNTIRQQMLRIDRLNCEDMSSADCVALQDRLQKALVGALGLVVSDYGEGVVRQVLFDVVMQCAHQGEVPVFVDSRFRIGSFKGVDTLTPNEPELAASVGHEIKDRKTLEKAGRRLLSRVHCDCLLVKLGRQGMALFQEEQPTDFVLAYGSDEVVDVTGAGDTVLAAWSLARVAGARPAEAMRLANTAGGIQVTKAGTAVVNANELLTATGCWGD
jgi:rfaE bifunctional protein kinase chain/domain